MLGVIRFPMAWFAAEEIGETGIWLSFAVSNVVGAAIAYAWYQRGTWREADLTDPAVDVEDAGSEATSTEY
jgi:Na+-driven multidrug efflux pump